MNKFDYQHCVLQASRIQQEYPQGTRIVLLQMGDDPNPIPPNTRGTVNFVDDIGTVFVQFDNGRSLGMALGEDSYRKLTEQELQEEALTTWGKYCSYLTEWAKDHSAPEYEGMSPDCYAEWLDNEYLYENEPDICDD